MIASWATDHQASKGRKKSEDACSTRTPFQRDRDRIIHCAAFRRLEYKTQVFINHEGDHYRTRLTHSLEVAQLARGMCRLLALDEDLGEAVALSHDLGHPPFGHAGEYGLQEAMKPYGGFDHNAQTLRIVTTLEQRYAEFDGLNLTWETLEGMAKHNGPLLGTNCGPLDPTLAAFNSTYDLALHSFAGPEAQVAALADDIAYNNHDIEDGVRAALFSIDELRFIPLIDEIAVLVDNKYGSLAPRRRVHEILRRLINKMVRDVINATQDRVEQMMPENALDVRAGTAALVQFSDAMHDSNKRLKSFLLERMYRHYRVNRMTSKARRVVVELFAFFHAEPECLPHHWQQKMDGMDEKERARIVCDYIAGMTDRFALDEYNRIFDAWARP